MQVTTDGYRPRALTAVRKQASPVASGLPFPAVGGTNYNNRELSDLESSTNPDLFRAYRMATPWTALCVDYRRDQVTHAEWDIVRKDPTLGDGDEDVRLRLIDLFNNPDRRGKATNYATWVGPVLEDYLVVGAGAYQPTWNGLTEIDGMRVKDGSKATENPVWTVALEEEYPLVVLPDGRYQGVPRWFYADRPGAPALPLASRDLVVLRANPTSYTTGLAPMQALHRFLRAEKDLFRSLHLAGKNLQPSGLIKIPDPNPGTVEAVTKMWRSQLQGRGGIGVVGVPADTDFIQVGVTDVAKMGVLEAYDIVIRGVAACFRMPLTALNWTRQLLERSAEEQGELADEGILNILRMLMGQHNANIVQRYPGADNLEFRYLQLPLAEEADSIEVLTAKAAMPRVYTINTLMDAAGEQRVKYPPEMAPFYEEPWTPAPEGGMHYQLPISLVYKLYVKPKLDAVEAGETLPTTGPDGLPTTTPPNPALPGQAPEPGVPTPQPVPAPTPAAPKPTAEPAPKAAMLRVPGSRAGTLTTQVMRQREGLLKANSLTSVEDPDPEGITAQLDAWFDGHFADALAEITDGD